ncbi:hypothetical protein [Azospirillum tabaci]|uniref:hypothetical protein n=1 Tax=Azospirillum tabaci TaxID=2752310 RepID=UPI001660CCF0|nr:hypothetical protein [Azospirillum tabaci]
MQHVLRCGLPITALLIACSSPTWAEQGGPWRGRAVLVVTSEKSVPVADKEKHTVSVTEYDGAVFTEVGGAFLANARYQVTDLTDTSGMVSGGYKTFTDADGSKVFARYALKQMALPVLKGEWEFLDGTGKYKGISGRGRYEVHVVSNTVLWDLLEGEYKLP